MEERKPAVQIEDMSVIYQASTVLSKITFEIPQGKIVGILGPNGAGKSTLLKAIVGLICPISGSVRCLGKSFASVRKHIAYIPQRNTVDWDFPITVSEVVSMGCFGRRGLFGRMHAKEKEQIKKALQDLGLDMLADRQISALSGGQQQKVFLARALVQEASIYLMDEPFAGIDLGTEKAIMDILRSLRNLGKTILLVHHDLYSVQEYFDWVVFLNQSIVDVGSVEKVFSKKNLTSTYGEHLLFLASKL